MQPFKWISITYCENSVIFNGWFACFQINLAKMLKETPRDKAHTEHEPERQKELTSMLLDMDAKHGQWIILYYTSTHFGNLSLHPLSLLSPYWWKANQSYDNRSRFYRKTSSVFCKTSNIFKTELIKPDDDLRRQRQLCTFFFPKLTFCLFNDVFVVFCRFFFS